MLCHSHSHSEGGWVRTTNTKWIWNRSKQQVTRKTDWIWPLMLETPCLKEYSAGQPVCQCSREMGCLCLALLNALVLSTLICLDRFGWKYSWISTLWCRVQHSSKAQIHQIVSENLNYFYIYYFLFPKMSVLNWGKKARWEWGWDLRKYWPATEQSFEMWGIVAFLYHC